MNGKEMEKKNTIRSFEDLEVWQKAHHKTLEIYKVTKNYPSEEKFGLISQMRRAAVSVPANITEGFRKKSSKDKINFYNIAQASLDEIYYYIILSKDLGYIQENQKLKSQLDEIARMLTGLIKAIAER